MCYYNGVRVSRAQLLELLSQEKEIPVMDVPVRSGFDYKEWPIITANESGWQLELAHWEFIAPWTKSKAELAESRKKFTTLNATAEKLFESRMYKASAEKKRCLVLSTGFYEWRHYKPAGASKEIAYPYYIHAADHSLMLMAGIYSDWMDKETGELIRNFAIVTTEANGLMAQIHNKKKRMPTILPKELAEKWISPIDASYVQELARFQADKDYLAAHTIGKDFRTKEDPAEHYDYANELPAIE